MLQRRYGWEERFCTREEVPVLLDCLQDSLPSKGSWQLLLLKYLVQAFYFLHLGGLTKLSSVLRLVMNMKRDVLESTSTCSFPDVVGIRINRPINEEDVGRIG
jgi:hypothetical protein